MGSGGAKARTPVNFNIPNLATESKRDGPEEGGARVSPRGAGNVPETHAPPLQVSWRDALQSGGQQYVAFRGIRFLTAPQLCCWRMTTALERNASVGLCSNKTHGQTRVESRILPLGAVC